MTLSPRATAGWAHYVFPVGALAGLLAIFGSETELLYPAIGLGVIAVGALALLRPIYAIYLAVILIPFETATAQSQNFGITPTEAVLVAAAVGWLARRLAKGGEIPRTLLLGPILLLLAAHIPSLFLATDQFVVFKQMFMWTAGLLLLLAVVSDPDEHATERLAGVIAITGAIVAAVAIVKSAGGTQYVQDFGGIVTNRAVGPFASPVLLGTFIALIVPVQLAFMLRGRLPLYRALGLAATTLSFGALALALARSAMVALAVACLWLVVFWRPARKPALGLAIVVLAMFVTKFNPAPAVFDTEVIEERISSIGSPDTHTAELRFQIWRKTPEMFIDNFPFGFGPKNLPVRAAEYDLVYLVGAPSNAHDTPLVIATELGVPGLIAAAWLFFAVIQTLLGALKNRDPFEHSLAMALVATFLVLAVDAITGYSYGANAFFLVTILLAGLAARLWRQQRMSQPAPTAPAEEQDPPRPGLATPPAERELAHA